jgi:chemotaxis-related protein WspD
VLAPFNDPLAGDLTNSVPSDSSLPPPEDCWNRIGFKGDRSCGELPKFGHCHNCPVFAGAAERLFARPLPDACVAERGARLERTGADGGPTLAVLVFRVGEEWLALEVSVLIEVGEPRVVHRVPHRREQLLRGLVNVRGELQLCVSLAELLGLRPTQVADHSPMQSGWLLVAEHERGRWALAVDEVAGVRRVLRERLTAIPVTVAQGKQSFAEGVFLDGERRVGLLDANRLFRTLQQTGW